MHCASLGEFEQGRPVIEAIKKLKPDYRIILTFFSPSGYEIRKNYSLADHVCYLPPDTPVNARKFISAINPACAIFVKYEFWHNYSTVLEKNGIPVYLISGIFRGNQHFFKWYGTFFRKILLRFSHIFVQDEGSLELLKGIGIENVTVAGDTRFDRVVGIADSAKPIPAIELFIGNEKVFLAGSSWRQDEEIIAKYINLQPGRMKWIFAPHEIDRSNIDRIVKLFDCGVVRFSELSGENSGARVLVIDNIGMLSAAYRYAYIAEVGGGFGKGIHNVLEAACWGIPVLFGPNYIKFREAVELIGCNGATSFSGYDEFASIMNNWLTDKDLYAEASRRAGQYVRANTGATGKILQKIIFQDINNPY
jgi:3-deoxy-D-manno-octulosonic-acid transferase